MHKQSRGRLYRPKRKRHAPCPILKMSVNGVSTILALHHGESKHDVAVDDYIRSCDWFFRLECSGSLSGSFEDEWSCDCPGGWRGNIACISGYKGCQLPVYRCLRSFATENTQHARPKIIVAPLTLSVQMGQGACSFHVCQSRQPIQLLCITMTNSCFNYRTYMSSNCWPSVDAHFNVLSIQYLLPSVYALIIIWTYWLPFCLIETHPFGKAKPSNLRALVALILMKYIHLGK